ncbi:hypothetical protein [Herpetosiphon geysericola]|uniref:Uncharacterized protein n=1 Tax=Herpetosiphon geysericola TaxID=70996 RepID=A0A0P6XUJ9_9CHLR|nr:hypothetical protein [Herpetosiphon geysericola]KPL88127.1 hypothetical protein SE18_10420 [Herpetosiphon geysericola]
MSTKGKRQKSKVKNQKPHPNQLWQKASWINSLTQRHREIMALGSWLLALGWREPNPQHLCQSVAKNTYSCHSSNSWQKKLIVNATAQRNNGFGLART